MLSTASPAIDKATAIASGPGLAGPGSVPARRACAEEISLPLVLDADGLNALEGRTGARRSEAPTVLTPHPAELARLLGRQTQEVVDDRLGSALDDGPVAIVRRPAEGSARTVVAAAGGERAVIPAGARAGHRRHGDVLTGGGDSGSPGGRGRPGRCGRGWCVRSWDGRIDSW